MYVEMNQKMQQPEDGLTEWHLFRRGTRQNIAFWTLLCIYYTLKGIIILEKVCSQRLAWRTFFVESGPALDSRCTELTFPECPHAPPPPPHSPRQNSVRVCHILSVYVTYCQCRPSWRRTSWRQRAVVKRRRWRCRPKERWPYELCWG